jgi:hypothetical protein
MDSAGRGGVGSKWIREGGGGGGGSGIMGRHHVRQGPRWGNHFSQTPPPPPITLKVERLGGPEIMRTIDLKDGDVADGD